MPDPHHPLAIDADSSATNASNAASDVGATAAKAEDDDPPQITTRDFYNGLSERAKLWILAMGAFIACVNLFGAWFIAYGAMNSLTMTSEDVAPFRTLFTDNALTGDQRFDLTARAMHVVTLSKLVANKQSLVLACFSGAFALAAIGFSLFVIGADGAFKVSATDPAKARIVFTGTAPGLLCFLICGLLIREGVQHQTTLDLPSYWSATANSKSPVNQNAEEKACPRIGKDGNCIHQK